MNRRMLTLMLAVALAATPLAQGRGGSQQPSAPAPPRRPRRPRRRPHPTSRASRR